VTAIDWPRLVRGLTKEATFGPPAELSAIRAAEDAVGASLPDDLRDLLLQTNGITGEWGLGLVWSAERIAADNARFRCLPAFRELYMPFEPLLFFADAGNGDQFAFRVLDGVVYYPDVYVWDHESDSRVWCANDLQTYLARWISGDLKV